MGGNVLADFFKSQEDRKRIQQIEQLRRKGHNFIKVRYSGNIIPTIDSEGVVYNLRVHGLRDVEAFEKTDINTGQTDWHSRPGARVLTFRQSNAGDIEADIWDDPDLYNRHFIASHPELEVVDPIVAREIRNLDPRSFKAELTNEEVLEREIAAKQRELDSLKKAKGISPTVENTEDNNTTDKPLRRRGVLPKASRNRKPKGRMSNGINKPAPGVDSTGVPRVATGGDTEGDSAAVQSGSQDTELSRERAESTV